MSNLGRRIERLEQAAGAGDDLGAFLQLLGRITTRIGDASVVASALGVGGTEAQRRLDEADFSEEELSRLPEDLAARLRARLNMSPDEVDLYRRGSERTHAAIMEHQAR